MKYKIFFILCCACMVFPATMYSQIQFFANFENGSIGEIRLLESKKSATALGDSIEQFSYHITTKADPANAASPSLTPSNRWFYFLMTGVKGKEIILNINANDAKRPVYSYDNVNFTRFTETEVPLENKSIQKRYEKDSVYIAYFTPYTESYLHQKIAKWVQKECVDTLCIGKSEDGRDMPLLIITNKGGTEPNNKKRIYIHGRVHPSETPASWHLDKMIDLLTSNLEYTNDLRDNAVFYILPFTNPDGVYRGMSRSNRNGINLEVNWADGEEVTAKEVKNIRHFLQKLTADGKPVDLFLNMHSQTDPNITYWIHTAESTSDQYYKELMLLANLTINCNPYFKRDDLSFSKVNSRYLEGWFWDHFGEKTLAATFETPYTYYNKKGDGTWVTVENLRESAINNLYAIGDYLGLGKTNRVIVENPARGRKAKAKSDHTYFYFGPSYLLTNKAGATVQFKGKYLKQGNYDVYMWSVGENLTTSKEGENEWRKIGEHTQTKTGIVKYTHKSENKGEKIDAILFINKPLLIRDNLHSDSL